MQYFIFDKSIVTETEGNDGLSKYLFISRKRQFFEMHLYQAITCLKQLHFDYPLGCLLNTDCSVF